MALTGTPLELGNVMVYVGVTGVNDNDVLIETADVSRYATFGLASTAGVMDVYVSIDGTNFLAGAISIWDMTGDGSVAVVETVAGALCQLRAKVMKIRVLQKGATAVENPRLLCWIA